MISPKCICVGHSCGGGGRRRERMEREYIVPPCGKVSAGEV